MKKKIKKYFLEHYPFSMTIELNEKDTNLILKALGELPAKDSMQMILRLQVAWNEQHPAEQPKSNEDLS